MSIDNLENGSGGESVDKVSDTEKRWEKIKKYLEKNGDMEVLDSMLNLAIQKRKERNGRIEKIKEVASRTKERIKNEVALIKKLKRKDLHKENGIVINYYTELKVVKEKEVEYLGSLINYQRSILFALCESAILDNHPENDKDVMEEIKNNIEILKSMTCDNESMEGAEELIRNIESFKKRYGNNSRSYEIIVDFAKAEMLANKFGLGERIRKITELEDVTNKIDGGRELLDRIRDRLKETGIESIDNDLKEMGIDSE